VGDHLVIGVRLGVGYQALESGGEREGERERY